MAQVMFASIPSPSVNVFHIGPLTIHFYGVFVAAAIAVAFVVASNRYKKLGGEPPDLISRIGIWIIVAGFVGARAGFVMTHSGQFAGRWWAVIAIWEGGIVLFGGLLGGAIAAYFLMRHYKGDMLIGVDAAAIAIPLAQAIGRWGNYFNQELFGTPSTLPWAIQIAPQNRPAQYAQFSTFHPTFLYESLWNLLVVGFLLWLERRKVLVKGNLFFCYLALYGVMRFLLELIRTDTTFRFLGISRNGWVALAATVGAVIVIVVRQFRAQPGKHTPAA